MVRLIVLGPRKKNDLRQVQGSGTAVQVGIPSRKLGQDERHPSSPTQTEMTWQQHGDTHSELFTSYSVCS